MVDVKDVRGLRVARAELSKKGIDALRAEIRVEAGVLTLRGVVSALPGVEVEDVRQVVEQVSHDLMQRGEFRDVVIDCAFGATNYKARELVGATAYQQGQQLFAVLGPPNKSCL